MLVILSLGTHWREALWESNHKCLVAWCYIHSWYYCCCCVNHRVSHQVTWQAVCGLYHSARRQTLKRKSPLSTSLLKTNTQLEGARHTKIVPPHAVKQLVTKAVKHFVTKAVNHFVTITVRHFLTIAVVFTTAQTDSGNTPSSVRPKREFSDIQRDRIAIIPPLQLYKITKLDNTK